MKRLKRLFTLLFMASLLAWVISLLFINQLPGSQDILSELGQDPIQVKLDAPKPITVIVEGKDYTVTPLYSYDIRGLVVSLHHSGSAFDIVHDMWGDKLNLKDLCLIWGSNVRGRLYDHFSFSSGNFTCFVKTDDYAAWQAFNPEQLSNNHILAVDEEVIKAIMAADIGDQVAFKGWLSEYSHAGGFHRSTSTTRQDTGDGACETIFVNEFKILKRGNPAWHVLHTGSGSLAVLLGLMGLLNFLKEFFFTPRRTAEEHYELAKDAVLARQYAKALRELNRALEASPDTAKYYKLRSALQERLGRYAEAHADMERCRHLQREAEVPDTVADFL